MINPALLGSSTYALIVVGSALLGAFFFFRRARADTALMPLYLSTLCAAFVGAKVVFVLSEGWLYVGTDRFVPQILAGKSILGGLLFGFLGAELAKRWLGYTKITGDLFATVVPIALIAGRIGCLSSGCCQGQEASPAWYTAADAHGVTRYATVQAEIVFNALFAVGAFMMRSRHLFSGQHFHIYLISYGVFRFFEEFFRQAPRIGGLITGYQVAALLCVYVGAIGAWRRYLRTRHETV